MAEPTVQVPVSLIERLRDTYGTGNAWDAVGPLIALLSQPTPTAEPCCNRPGDPNWHTLDGSHVVPPDIEEDTPVTPPTN